jgi:hypothetical protein
VVPFFPIQNFVAVQYKGPLNQQNVNLLTTPTQLVSGTNTAGFLTKQGHQSVVINTVMDWLNTYPGQAVSINVQSQGTIAPIDQIVMLYIDNSRNPNNVTVGFTDSQQFLEAPAFTTGYYPVFTQNLFFNVYNGTTGKPPVTAQSMTAIIICNFAVPGFLSQDTLSITFNSSNGPLVPTIGDRVTTNFLGSSTANPVTLLPSIALPMQYVITGISVTAENLFVDPSIPSTNAGLLLTTDAEGPVTNNIRQWNIGFKSEFENSTFFQIADETGLNIPVQVLQAFLTTDNTTPFTLQPQTFIVFNITFAQVTL